MSYRAPVNDIFRTLKNVADMDDVLATGRFGDLSDDLVAAILEEAGRFAGDRLEPLNRVGDQHGASLDNGVVKMPPGWREAYDAYCAGGWNSLGGPDDFGGQGLPTLLEIATAEIWCSANMAFSLNPMLTVGAVHALKIHGSAELKDRYLPKLVSGEWTGTMNLTEPQAGSDLNALRTRAEPRDDGSYRIKGQKIYISYGEHDLTDNIAHLVLARLPDAPAGTRGISLFMVPKFLAEPDGTPGARNDVHCSGIEHKMGIHASPTCTMIFGDGVHTEAAGDGAVGYLVGEENQGLRCMFTMMNLARLHVGIQGVAVAEAATQKAVAFAGERRQGTAPGKTPSDRMDAIIEHPDVLRMLTTMRAQTQAIRSICYACAQAIDLSAAQGDDMKNQWKARADILTPIAKAYSTDIGIEVASLGVQVHGGMGFIEETGAAQYLRDARIAAIYEGTNGIQAVDLLLRKLPIAGGNAVRNLIDEFGDVAEDATMRNARPFSKIGARLRDAISDLSATTTWLLIALEEGRRAEALAGATPYLRLFGVVAGGAYLAKAALAETEGNRAARTALFFADNVLTTTSGLRQAVEIGADSVIGSADLLEAS